MVAGEGLAICGPAFYNSAMTDTILTLDELAAQIAALEAEQRELFAALKPIEARLRKIADLREELVGKTVAYIDPASAEGLDALWRAAWDNGRGNGPAKDALQTYARSFAPEIYDIRWYREEESGEIYPSPHLMLTRGQDVSALADRLLAFVRALTPGRKIAHVALFEHSLSINGSYGIDINLASGEATLWHDRRDNLFAGSLQEVLTRAARDHWYEREDGATDDSEDSVSENDQGW
jgi:hypothetical protein